MKKPELILTVIALEPNGRSRTLLIRYKILQHKSIWPVLEKRQCEAVDFCRVAVSVCIPLDTDGACAWGRAFGVRVEESLGVVASAVDIKIVPVGEDAGDQDFTVCHGEMGVVPCVSIYAVQTCDGENLEDKLAYDVE